MNKIFITLLLFMSLPVFASCPINGDKPCTTHDKDVQTVSTTKDPKPNIDEKKENPFLPKDELSDNILDNNALQGYDADCQFGFCLP